MLSTFFDIIGIVYYEFVPIRHTVNQTYYLEVLKTLHEKVKQKRPELFASNTWIMTIHLLTRHCEGVFS